MPGKRLRMLMMALLRPRIAAQANGKPWSALPMKLRNPSIPLLRQGSFCLNGLFRWCIKRNFTARGSSMRPKAVEDIRIGVTDAARLLNIKVSVLKAALESGQKVDGAEPPQPI